MIVSFLGCCWYIGGNLHSPYCWSSCNVRKKMGAEGMEGESGVVIEGICEDDMQNLSWRLVWILIRAGITFGKVVVVAV